jgi:hypothetical protein
MKSKHRHHGIMKCRFRGCETTTECDVGEPMTWVCLAHHKMLTPSHEERAQARELNGLIRQGQLAIGIDGWLAPIPAKQQRPAPCMYEDNGTPRFIQPGAPAGVTPLPGDLVLGGSDPALDMYRMTDDDDGQQ